MVTTGDSGGWGRINQNLGINIHNPAGGTVVKNLPANSGGTRNAGSTPGLERSPPWSRKWKPTPLFLPVKLHGTKQAHVHTRIKQINNKVLLHSTGNYIQYLVITYNGKKMDIYMCVHIYIYIYI